VPRTTKPLSMKSGPREDLLLSKVNSGTNWAPFVSGLHLVVT